MFRVLEDIKEELLNQARLVGKSLVKEGFRS